MTILALWGAERKEVGEMRKPPVVRWRRRRVNELRVRELVEEIREKALPGAPPLPDPVDRTPERTLEDAVLMEEAAERILRTS